MTKFILVVPLLLLGLIAAPPAVGHTIVIAPEGATFPYQAFVDESRVSTPDLTLELIETEGNGCPPQSIEYVACTNPALRKIWLRPAGLDDIDAADVLYHEIGHNVDAFTLPEWMRGRFRAIYGWTGAWDVESDADPYDPAERFADVYAECARRLRLPLHALGVTGLAGSSAPLGGPRRHNRACRMLRKL